MRSRPPLALVPLAARPVVAQTAGPPAKGTMLEVQAEGRVTRVPDIAIIMAGVVTSAAEASAALSDNAARVVAVRASC